MSTSSSMHDTCQDPSVGEEVVCSLHEPPSAISGIFWDLPGSDKACFPMGILFLAALHSKTWLQERERPLTFSFFFFKSFYLLYPQRECQSVHCIRNWKAFLSSSLCESREKSCFGFQACSGEPHFACLVWFEAQIPLTAGTPLTALKERKRKGKGEVEGEATFQIPPPSLQIRSSAIGSTHCLQFPQQMVNAAQTGHSVLHA